MSKATDDISKNSEMMEYGLCVPVY